MIDLTDLRTRPDLYQDAAKKKRIAFDVKGFLKLDKKRREKLLTVENERAEQNKASKQIAAMDKAERAVAIKEMKSVSDRLKKAEEELAPLEDEWNRILLTIPSIPLPNVPVGKDDTENREVRRWGDPSTALRVTADAIKDHVALGHALDILDIPRGVKVAGSRSYFLKGNGARLELAVMLFTIDHLRKKGFTLFTPPVLANWDAFMGTSYFPGGEEQAYAVGVQKSKGEAIEPDGLYLIGTSEVSVASYHGGETLTLEELPKRYCGLSHCFRREAGTYGKDTHGLYRIHQFQKVEQVVLCENDPEVSAAMHRELLTNAEEVLQALELPYRVVDVCTGDMGRGQVFKNDIETWMPSRDGYGETHSCSTFYDFQSRRLGIKYAARDGQKRFVHTLNNTCIASPRILIPILEINQNQDGSVTIPKVLRPYMGEQERIAAQ